MRRRAVRIVQPSGFAPPERLPYVPAPTAPPPQTGIGTGGPTVKKAKPLPHRNRGKSARHRAKRKAKLRRVRVRRSSGERKTYR